MPIWTKTERLRLWEETPIIRRELERCQFVVRKRPYKAIWDLYIKRQNFTLWFLANKWHWEAKEESLPRGQTKAAIILKNIINKANDGNLIKQRNQGTAASAKLSPDNIPENCLSHHDGNSDRSPYAPLPK